MKKKLCFALLAWLGVICAATAAQRPQKVDSAVFAGPAPDQNGYLAALQLTPNAGWHTYWLNSGDAGLPTKIRWTLPDGVEAGPILWPTPQAYREGELMTYGYGEQHSLLTRLQIDDSVPDDASVSLKARWLVCKEICIPESRSFDLSVKQLRQSNVSAANKQLQSALQALPEPLNSSGLFAVDQQSIRSWIPLPAHWQDSASQPMWFSARPDTVDHAGSSRWQHNADGIAVIQPRHREYSQAQDISGVLSFVVDGQTRSLAVSLQAGTLPDDLSPWQNAAADGAGQGSKRLWLVLLMAFVGGLILNLMPCVFPVLSLKAMSLARAGSLREKRQESLAYTAGVVLSFVLIAALLLALRAGGAALGWGFQLQNPLVVGALACLMFLLGLALLGWTQIGMRWMGMGQDLTGQGGLRGAFFTGVLAVVVASPCSAPFMGSALGYAVLQPAVIALSIFVALGLGLAAPLAALPWTPGLAQRLPKPGPWMEKLKHWMALPMLLTAIWLFWVLWRQAGVTGLGISLLATALLAAGLRQKAGQTGSYGWQKVTMLAGGLLLLAPLVLPSPSSTPSQNTADLDWQTWSSQQVTQARENNRLVFVDFTADWCLSCLANESAVLRSKRVRDVFEAHDVLLLKADWTQYDPKITAALATFDRNGVPLYLLYPQGGAPAKVLPQILTRNIVEQAVITAAKPEA